MEDRNETVVETTMVEPMKQPAQASEPTSMIGKAKKFVKSHWKVAAGVVGGFLLGVVACLAQSGGGYEGDDDPDIPTDSEIENDEE